MMLVGCSYGLKKGQVSNSQCEMNLKKELKIKGGP